MGDNINHVLRHYVKRQLYFQNVTQWPKTQKWDGEALITILLHDNLQSFELKLFLLLVLYCIFIKNSFYFKNIIKSRQKSNNNDLRSSDSLIAKHCNKGPFKKYVLKFWTILDPSLPLCVILCYFPIPLPDKYVLYSMTPPLVPQKINKKRLLIKIWLGLGEFQHFCSKGFYNNAYLTLKYD